MWLLRLPSAVSGALRLSAASHRFPCGLRGMVTLKPSLAVACRESDDLRRAGIGRLEWEEADFSLADPYASSAGSWRWLLVGRGTGR